MAFIKYIIQKIKKLNLHPFDVLVIFCLFLILGGLLFIRLSTKKEWVSVRVKLASDEWWWETKPPDYWYVQGLSVGQKAYNTFGKNIAEITNIESFDLGGPKRMTFVEMKLAASFNKRTRVYMYNYQPLQVGKPIDLAFGSANLHGLVTYVGSEKIPYEEKEIEVKLFSIFPWQAESYQLGLQIKDSLGRVLAQIEEVRVEKAKNYEFSDSRGRKFVIKGIDDTRRDVTLRLKIKVFPYNDRWYFVDGAAIKIGEEIWFHFPQMTVQKARISKILE